MTQRKISKGAQLGWRANPVHFSVWCPCSDCANLRGPKPEHLHKLVACIGVLVGDCMEQSWKTAPVKVDSSSTAGLRRLTTCARSCARSATCVERRLRRARRARWSNPQPYKLAPSIWLGRAPGSEQDPSRRDFQARGASTTTGLIPTFDFIVAPKSEGDRDRPWIHRWWEQGRCV